MTGGGGSNVELLLGDLGLSLVEGASPSSNALNEGRLPLSEGGGGGTISNMLLGLALGLGTRRLTGGGVLDSFCGSSSFEASRASATMDLKCPPSLGTLSSLFFVTSTISLRRRIMC